MSYNVIDPFHIVVAASMGADVTSKALWVQNQDNIGFQLNWTGTPVGTFSVEISMDYAQDSLGNITNAGYWIALVLSSVPNASGSADQAYIDLNQLSTPWIRVKYGRTSGTGVLEAYASAKGV